jgi:hypothetical protein
MQQFDYDLDALIVEDEDAPPWRFKWAGKVYEMALMATMPVQTQLDIEGAPIEDQMRLILGDVEFADLISVKGAGGRAMTAGRMRDLVTAYMEHQGLVRGKSDSSPSSSGNTARPLKRTSRSARRR